MGPKRLGGVGGGGPVGVGGVCGWVVCVCFMVLRGVRSLGCFVVKTRSKDPPPHHFFWEGPGSLGCFVVEHDFFKTFFLLYEATFELLLRFLFALS